MNPISSLPLAIPGRTFRLFGRFWLALIFWYLLGRGLHDGLLEVAAHVNRVNSVIAYSIVATAILCSLVAFVFMFQTIQPGLPTIWSLRKRDAQLDPTIKSPERRGAREQLRAVGLALLPFLLVYSARNLFEDDLRSVAYRTWEIDFLGDAPERAEFTFYFAGAAVVAYILVKICEFITRRTRNPVTALLAAVGEANWIFFALFGLQTLWGAAQLRISSTLAWHNFSGLRDLIGDIGPVLPIRFHNVFSGLFSFDLGWFAMFSEPLGNGILLPIYWLAIAGVCYGREMEDVKGLVDSRRFARFTGRWDQAPAFVKRYSRAFPTPGMREKYYPPFHAIRLLLSAGVPAILFFCVCYSAIELGGAVLQQSITTVIGPHSAALFWDEVQPVLGVAVDAVTESVRICLLAVTFDLAMSKFTTAKAQAVGGSGAAAKNAEATASVR